MHNDRKESDYMIPAIKTRYAAMKFAAYSFFSAGIFFLLLMFFVAVGEEMEIITNVLAALLLICLALVLFFAITSITLALNVTSKRNRTISNDKMLAGIFKSGRSMQLSALKEWDLFRTRFGIGLAVAVIVPLITFFVLILLLGDAEGAGGLAVIIFILLFGWAIINSLGFLQNKKEEALFRYGAGAAFWNLRSVDDNTFKMLESERAVIVPLNMWDKGLGDFAANVCKEVIAVPDRSALSEVSAASDLTNSVYCFTGDELNEYYGREIIEAEQASSVFLIAVPVISCTGGERNYLISQKPANSLNNCLINAGGFDYGWFTHLT